jgi:hypothetical protein
MCEVAKLTVLHGMGGESRVNREFASPGLRLAICFQENSFERASLSTKPTKRHKIWQGTHFRHIVVVGAPGSVNDKLNVTHKRNTL